MISLCPFGDHAASYAEYDLVTFPVGGDTGKMPLVKNWQKFNVKTYEKLPKRYSHENIGIRNDNKITIVDIDDPLLIHDALSRFGDTPIKIATPSGGYHCWYKSSGERRVIGLDGQKIDILGNGGFAVAPPSRKPSGESYSFIEGSEYDLNNLPPLQDQSLLKKPEESVVDTHKGHRNTELFNFCRSVAIRCRSEQELSEQALKQNARFFEPLPVNEVLKTVAVVWGYKVNGTLLIEGGNKMIVDLRLIKLTSTPDALALALILTKNHGARREPFAISQPEMKIILGWGGRRRVSAAIDILLESSIIQRIGKGGPTGRAYQYQWVN